MARHASAISAAELRVVQSRRELRGGLRRLRFTVSQPSFLTAAAAGAVLGFLLARRARPGAVAGTVATALIRHALKHRAS